MDGGNLLKKMIVPILILSIVAYMEGPLELEHDREDFFTSAPTFTTFRNDGNLKEKMFVNFETVLLKKEIIEGYIVETYREYEVIRNQEGNIIESVPTMNFNYLRYHILKP